MKKIKDKEIRKIYVENTIKNGWSRNILSIQIETEFHNRIGNSNNNFSELLPPNDSDLVNNTIKDPYIFKVKGRLVKLITAKKQKMLLLM